MDQKIRPTSVTVISILMLVFAGISMLSLPVLLLMPQVQEAYRRLNVSIPLVILLMLLATGITIVSATAMLKGYNWGRILYLISYPVLFTINMVILGFQPLNVLNIIFYIVILVILAQHNATAYFSKTIEQPPAA